MATWRIEHLERLDSDTLDSFNRRLRTGQTDLDWSAVKTIPPRKQLDRLLAGLNLSKNSDILGIETVPDFLYESLLAILSTGQEPGPYGEAKPVKTSKYQKPAIWFPDGQDFDADATVQKRISAPQDIADLVSQREDRQYPGHPARDRVEQGRNAHKEITGSNLSAENYEQKMQAARARIVLDMKALSTPDTTKLYDRLQPLITAYKLWIEGQERHLRPNSGYRQAGAQEMQSRLQACHKTLTRLEEGINLLKRRPDAAQSFAFMNRAMCLQHVHYLHAQEKQRDSKAKLLSVDRPENYRWEPFQLALLLLVIPALTNIHHLDRSEESSAIADLFWSLPGVDKTDVYLGLIAYDLAIRRLQGYVGGRSGENGIAVLLRYTHLSQEQLQRIYTLLCACETIRRRENAQWGESPHRERSRWGESPFRLGVWTGNRPAVIASDDDLGVTWKKQDMKQIAENSLSISYCPWCGEAIVEKDGTGKGETRYCGDLREHCPFSKKGVQGEGLPALLLDEEIYRITPSVLIATADTFMNDSWKEETRILFGQVEKKSGSQALSRYSVQTTRGVFLRPPDLVLQDDLEQISGHTRSQAGQEVIDHLASWKIDEIKVRPKVVAALPGFRQASQETRAILCMRETKVFPPPGRSTEENFFFS